MHIMGTNVTKTSPVWTQQGLLKHSILSYLLTYSAPSTSKIS